MGKTCNQYSNHQRQAMNTLSAIFCTTVLFTCVTVMAQSRQKVIAGRLDHIENFSSAFIENMTIDIWLPESYDGRKKFSVLYMHDGQMLFDSTTTWNGQSWNVDDVITNLLQKIKIKNVIVVGIWNTGETRHPSYFPQKPYDYLTSAEKDTVTQQLKKAGRLNNNFQPTSDNYLNFLVKELKPMIDKTYTVHTNRKNTFVAGSSMGGLISLYAICEYPEVFGGAACLSTHWPGTFTMQNNPIPQAFLRYLQSNLPDPKKHKLYFDCGDQGLDALYPPVQNKVDDLMQSKGYTTKNWVTHYFNGKDHSEKAWNERLDIPLLFLLSR
jgi:predicted alpha/beta superfamily hydrolase